MTPQSIERQRREPGRLPLLPRHRIFLRSNSSQAQRFTRLFKSTWSRLPLSVRRDLCKFWRTTPLTPLTPIFPHIVLVKGCLDQSFARVRFFGQEMLFEANLVERMPDNLVEDLIAHELAHVAFFAWEWNLAIK